MSDSIRQYLKSLEQELAAGNATEQTHRPALKALIEALAPEVKATNEPRHVECGAPDFAISRPVGLLTIGYAETKDIGKSLDEAERSEQLRRYRRSLGNLVLTDYLEFRWYVEGERRQTARLARTDLKGKLAPEKGGAQAVTELLQNFLAHQPQQINTPQELALRMARLTHMIRDIIVEAFAKERASNLLWDWRRAFARVLIADLDQPEKTAEFADMFAQTLAYGLFSARVMDTTPGFTRQEAQRLIPRTNPFLREFFAEISGISLDDEPYAGFVDDLAALLDNTDMAAVLANFGQRTRQQDPVVHFYETFLAAYDPKLREARGVYYTPEPIVSYIVRSVDYLLKTHFNCPQGLADSTKITVRNTDPSLMVKGTSQPRKTNDVHKVLVLDPACGTGTFLYAVIDHIRQQYMQSGNAGLWSGYVREHLLPRLFGFELLMAPYAVAHFKLGLQLAGHDLSEAQRRLWAYDFASDERIGVYLTNTLEAAHEMTGLSLFTQFVADETNAANRIKQDLPILVVMGNPPYSGHSANRSWEIKAGKRVPTFIGRLVQDYYQVDGQPLGEQNPKYLLDDYVKFIRWGQWRIERTDAGVLALITNNGYLDNPTFRGMRQVLMNAFTDIYILDLHGSTKKKETAPDGSKDGNVFDIQQGVAIGIFVKEPGKTGPAQVHHTNLWGVRENKYSRLMEHSVETTNWTTLMPKSPFYLFAPQNVDLRAEYEVGWRPSEIFVGTSTGIKTHRDHFVLSYEMGSLRERIEAFRDPRLPDDLIRSHYDLPDTRDWKLGPSRRSLMLDLNWEESFTVCTYRPFDFRYLFYHPDVVELAREDVMNHLLAGHNVALGIGRQGLALGGVWDIVLVANHPIDTNAFRRGGVQVFPLYIYSGLEGGKGVQRRLLDASPWPPGKDGRVPNLNPQFVAELEKRLGLRFVPEGLGDLEATFGPEDTFHYIYAILHSPTYRARYAEFLKIDFPRLPLTSDRHLFRRLCVLGKGLVALHLLESPAVSRLITRYPIPGDSRVEKGYPRYLGLGEPEPGTGAMLEQGSVYVNQRQYVGGVSPEVWEFHVGGYQVCQKWLKDRGGRQLSYDDLTHYQKIIVAISETLRLMEEIDKTIPGWPIR